MPLQWLEGWRVDEYEDDDGQRFAEITNAIGYVVAQFPLHLGTEREAGARAATSLCLAAPHMLQVLRSMLDSTERFHDMILQVLRETEPKNPPA